MGDEHETGLYISLSIHGKVATKSILYPPTVSNGKVATKSIFIHLSGCSYITASIVTDESFQSSASIIVHAVTCLLVPPCSLESLVCFSNNYS